MDNKILKEILSYVWYIAIAFVAAFIITHFIIINTWVPTGSMNNTIMDNDKVIGLRFSYAFSSPKRGDIVIFKYPDDENKNFVKRVIGIPGDVVEISDGQVSVNGEVLDEPYIKEPMDTSETLNYIVPENSYFVMGDNRNHSNDARYWKTHYVSKDKILAKGWLKYYNTQTKKINFKILE